ncbi:MAG: protein TolR [Micavibrio aeruginosavorus]|nr:protein TolR [Micavibrio aeruginosavorus]
MGASLNASGRSRSGRRSSYTKMSEINVTPFVDVMLVLLIVFMVTAPLLTAGVPIDLPKSQAKQIQDEDNKPIEVTVSNDGKIFVGETEVEMERLIALLSAMTNNDPDRRVFIRGDQKLAYGQVMEVIGAINKGGFRKVALISAPSK